MSGDMWHVYGVGFNLEYVNKETYKKFLLDHEPSLRKVYKDEFVDILIAYLNESTAPELWEIREMMPSNSAAEPIALIMYAETGIKFDYPGLTEDDEDYVLFCRCYPWELNEEEKKLSSLQSLLDVMSLYARKLGLSLDSDVDLTYSG